MIRHFAAGLGTLAALTTTAIAIPATAHAATVRGVLIVNQRIYFDPSGCLTPPPQDPMTIVNATMTTVTVYSGPNCTGDVVEAVYPESAMELSGRSVSVPQS